ncbi:hypothetical protein DBV15_12333 [Temnothorax longispinosus]|uniref:THAP-type domain-containing protein n=1 Tax=Temnothorax longispinosus TaxID=300112 RepID=A0A4S2KAE6_9HYME|nr:hypothetical protein DBV15_12333 [Temnothorax longispinosus]
MESMEELLAAQTSTQTLIIRILTNFNKLAKAKKTVSAVRSRINSLKGYWDVIQRAEVLKNHKCCFNCLRQGHLPWACKSKNVCTLCKRKHHTLIHREKYAETNEIPASTSKGEQNAVTTSNLTSTQEERSNKGVVSSNNFSNTTVNTTLLPTASVLLKNKSRRSVRIRALLDQGSQASFVTESVVQLLGAERKRVSIQVSGIGESKAGSSKSIASFTVEPCSQGGPVLPFKAFVLPKLTNYLPQLTMMDETCRYLSSLDLADSELSNQQGWKCIIGGCTSPAKAPGHYFPKNKELMKKWLEAISVPWISNLSEEEIRKCRICHIHFSENSYIFTPNRRRLKHDAIPSLNLLSGIIETSEPNMNQVQEENNGIIDISQPSTSQVREENTTSRINLNIDVFEKEIQQFDPEILEVSKSVNRTNHVRRNDIPSLNVSSGIIETSKPNMNQVHEEINGIIDIPQPSTSQVQEENTTSRININIDVFEEETQQFDPEILEISKSVNCTNHGRRNILGNITRKNNLTPIAKGLYTKSRMFRIQNNALRRNFLYYKQRLKYATKFSSLIIFKKYSALTNTQKMFIDMQIKNLRKHPKKT